MGRPPTFEIAKGRIPHKKAGRMAISMFISYSYLCVSKSILVVTPSTHGRAFISRDTTISCMIKNKAPILFRVSRLVL